MILYEIFNDNKEINLIRNDSEIQSFIKSDKAIIEFQNNIEKFILNNKIELTEDANTHKIVYTCFAMILIYFKAVQGKSDYIATKKLRNFIISSNRILEFIIYIMSTDDEELIDIFLGEYKEFTKHYYFFLQKISKEIKNKNFTIKQSNKKNYIILDEIPKNTPEIHFNPKKYYFSAIKTQPFEKKIDCLMDHYLKLDDQIIESMYFINQKNGDKKKSNKNRDIDKIAFGRIASELSSIQYGSTPKREKLSLETQKDVDVLSNKFTSPILDQEAAYNVSEKFAERIQIANQNNKLDIKIESNFKRYQIARAITSSIAKKNLLLHSDYSIPEPESLREIISEMFIANKDKTTIIILSILFGTSIENIILSLKDNVGMKYQKSKQQVIFDLNKSFFAKPINTKNQLFQKTASKFYIQISQLFEMILNIAKNYIDKPPVNNISEIKADINEFLKISKKHYEKTIILNLNSLGLIMYQYFKKFHNKSNISLFYIKEISKNEQAKLCYCASNARLYNLENWIIKLSEILNIPSLFNKKNEIFKTIEYNNWIGSNYYLKPSAFKNFLLDIEKLYYSVDNNIEKFNLKMIYLRYSLALLLATRDFNNSCNLSQYSKRFKILLLQEKAKSIYTAKRAIPLCEHAITEIEQFYILKSEYQLSSDHPVFISHNEDIQDEIPITKKLTIELIKKMKNYFNNEQVERIIKFIHYTKLNFGRHVVTSYMVHSEVKGEYIDAFLNHYTMGTEDQGMYSNFNNSCYINIITQTMEEIVEIYYPRYMDFINE